MTVTLPIARRATKCLVPGASAVYLFNEGSGTTLRDHSGNARDGTLGADAAAPTWGPTGLTFDGGDKVTIPTITLSGPLTVQIVATRTSTAALQFAFGHTTNKIGFTAGANSYWIRVVATGNANPAVADGGTLPHLLTVVRGSDDKVDAAVDTAAFSRVFSNTAQAGDSTYTLIGTDNSSPLTGTVMFIALYPFALTAAQVAQNYATVKGMLASRGVALP